MPLKDLTHGLRQRPTSGFIDVDDKPGERLSGEVFTAAGSPPLNYPASRSLHVKNGSFRHLGSAYRSTTLFLHCAAFILILYGLILRHGLHNGDECEMTYSMRNYVPIAVHARFITTKIYKLYKFVDGRDPRHQHLLSRTTSQQRHHCAKDPLVVIYIPGHWGSYTQCRSLGAHGIQLTRQYDGPKAVHVLNSLRDDTSWNGKSALEEKFVYEVYCVDFAEQGGALHGNLIRQQSLFVADVIQQLSVDCSVSAVTLVGHSIGGLVAKAVSVYAPPIAHRIRSIITLATPHVASPYSFDESIRDVYRDIDLLDSQVLVTSISGGLKDELVPATFCESSLGLSIIGGTSLGMDHKAIVWCHQVLEKVRNILFLLSHDEGENRKLLIERIGAVNANFMKFVTDQRERYILKNGYISYVAIESAMIYNVDLLLVMYSLLCGLNLMLPKLGPLVGVLCIFSLSTLLSNHPQSRSAVLILSLLSSAVLWLVRRSLAHLQIRFTSGDQTIRSNINGAFVMVTIISTLFGTITATLGSVTNQTPRIKILSSLFLGMISWLSLAPLFRTEQCDARSVIFSAFTLIALPLLTVGKVVLIRWNIIENREDNNIMPFVLKVLIPVAIRFIVGNKSCGSNEQPMFSIAHAVNIFTFAPGMFQVGGAFLVSYYLAWVSIIEVSRVCL